MKNHSKYSVVRREYRVNMQFSPRGGINMLANWQAIPILRTNWWLIARFIAWRTKGFVVEGYFTNNPPTS